MKKTKLNILFVIYNDFHCNSAIHVHGFASALVELGHKCIVAVPDNKKTASELNPTYDSYIPAEYDEILKEEICFPDHLPPDIVHIWTPREITRKYFIKLKKKYNNALFVVHLEDNEENIYEKQLGLTRETIQNMPLDELTKLTTDTISHPVFFKEFLNEADGITIIIDTLSKFVPKKKPNMILWPIIDIKKFSKTKNNALLRRELKIKEGELVTCYTGNVHPSNAHEVRSLYLAVALANREGFPAKLIRTGNDYCKFLGENAEWAHKNSIELGRVSTEKIPKLLALADFLIQPGKSDEFNDYRLPSKIPEFLAMGKPVIIPNTNIGRYLKNNYNAIITNIGDGMELLDIIKRISSDKTLKDMLSKNSRNFAIKNFNKKIISQKLEAFYRRLIK